MEFCISLISDVHLEFGKVSPRIFIQYENTDTIVVAGDLGYFSQPLTLEVLRQLRDLYEFVIFVPGNHEYYECIKHGVTVAECDAYMAQKCKDLEVIFLQKSVFVHPKTKVAILGCTLWSSISDNGASRMMDFVKIFRNNFEYLQIHSDHVAWLKYNIPKYENVIVVTHHLPTLKAINKEFAGSDNSGFATDLEYLFAPNVIGWLCGHTHCPLQMKLSNAILTINPTGYPEEKRCGSFPEMPISFLLK